MSKVYLITYDLNSEGQNYENVIQSIKDSALYWCTYWDSSFLIKSNLTANQIFDKIKPYIDSNDRLIIIEANPANHQGWLEKDQWAFVNEKIFG